MKRPFWLYLPQWLERLGDRRAAARAACAELRELEARGAGEAELAAARGRVHETRRALRRHVLRPRRACLEIRRAVAAYDDEQQRVRTALAEAGDGDDLIVSAAVDSYPVVPVYADRQITKLGPERER